MSDAMRATEIVGQLWRDVGLQAEAWALAGVPDLPPTGRMIHDPDLLYLNSHADDHLAMADLLVALIPLLNSMAQRRDELTAELRLLREAMVAQSQRLAEREDVLHRLLEERLDRLEREQRQPW